MLSDKCRKVTERMQRVALLACVRACRTVATETLQVLAGSKPWDLEARRLSRYKSKRGLPFTQLDLCSEEQREDADASAAQAVMTIWQSGECVHPDRCRYATRGHGSMNAYLHRRSDPNVNPNCQCNNGEEDSSHVLTTCNRYDAFRNLQSMGVTTESGELNVSRVLATEHTCRAFVDFAEQAFRLRKEETIATDISSTGHSANLADPIVEGTT